MNLPNILTLVRMGMVPVVILFFILDEPFWALGFFLLAGFTDVLDGWIARKYQLITVFGQVMDPLADKLMLMTTLTCLYLTGRIPLAVPLIVFIKEWSMITAAALLYRKHIVQPANLFGKLATLLFTVAVILSFMADYVDPLHTVFLFLSTAVAVFAMFSYGAKVLRMNPHLFKK